MSNVAVAAPVVGVLALICYLTRRHWTHSWLMCLLGMFIGATAIGALFRGVTTALGGAAGSGISAAFHAISAAL
jgi:hypothetical protein